MPQVINTNVASMFAQAKLGAAQKDANVALERLSTGLRINSAKDDAAGLSISSRLTTQISGMNQAIRNANDGVSLVQTAEGALNETTSMLQRLRELAIQSANTTNTADDRAALNSEASQLKSEINRIASKTSFNNVKLLDGTFTSKNFHVGTGSADTISVSIAGMSGSDLGVYKLQASSATTANTGTSSAIVSTGGTPLAGGIGAQTLTVSGASGSSTVSVSAGDSAYTVAQNVNAKESSTGVSAQATNKVTLDNLLADGTVGFTLGDGSNTAAISATVTTTDLSNLTDAINAVSGTTGISAVGTGNSIVLTQADGKNITVADATNTAAGGDFDLSSMDDGDAKEDTITIDVNDTTADDSGTITGFVTFLDDSDFSVKSSIAETAGGIVEETGGAGTVVTGSQTLLSAVSLTSVANATAALDTIDAALDKVNSERAALGAVQNRFESTITNLSTTSTNLTAARSRIQDADFAQETASLARAQILQQAGISVLAQANAMPQNVLALLQ